MAEADRASCAEVSPFESDQAASERVARDVLENLLEGCQVIGFDWKYLYANDAAAAQGHRSREDLLGRTMMECYPGIDQSPFFGVLRRCMQERKRDRMENEFDYADGTKGLFELRFIPVPRGICILSLDLTESKRTSEALAKSQDQLQHSQKLDAVGRLAGGVAHDFNNMLSVILSYSALALADLKPSDPLREDIEEIRKAGERAAALTRQLLAFSRQQMLEPRVLDLDELVRGMQKMLERIIGEDITLEVSRGVRVSPVFADPGQLEQVLMNLVVNARDAMPRGGKLTIETSNVNLAGDYTKTHFGVEGGDYVMLAVSDTGMGMDKETQARIFEPFFTTKAPGSGTGLGLSTVYGSIKQSGGHIWVYSEPGKGTSFKVYLPARATPAADKPSTIQPQETLLTGSETILLVEDDEQVRVVAEDILRRAGYHVLQARNAGEALLTCEQFPQRIHLLLTDVVMPQMSGVQLARRLAQIRPDMKVLCMSGYTDEAVLRHGMIESGLAFVQKPLTPDRLLSKVRTTLGSG